MSVPQRLTFVTLGARDLPTLRRFYRSLGWVEAEGATDDVAAFACGSVRLALYPLDLLAAEAAPGASVVAPGVWNGVTLAVNVDTSADVDAVVASPVRPPSPTRSTATGAAARATSPTPRAPAGRSHGPRAWRSGPPTSSGRW